MSDKKIPWMLGTLYKNGWYNPTFTFEVVAPTFGLICQYFQLTMPRVTTGAAFRVLQSNVNKNNWAAWTTGNTMYVSNVFNFGMSRRRCSKVTGHEFGHYGNGTSHSKDPEALMAPDGGTSQGWVQDDLRWFGKYKLRGAMPPRGIFATTFPDTRSDDLDQILTLGVANGIWDRFLDRFRPVYQ